MGSSGIQIVCVALGVLGLIGAVVCCAVPRWKVTSFTGANIVTAQVRLSVMASRHLGSVCCVCVRACVRVCVSVCVCVCVW